MCNIIYDGDGFFGGLNGGVYYYIFVIIVLYLDVLDDGFYVCVNFFLFLLEKKLYCLNVGYLYMIIKK